MGTVSQGASTEPDYKSPVQQTQEPELYRDPVYPDMIHNGIGGGNGGGYSGGGYGGGSGGGGRDRHHARNEWAMGVEYSYSRINGQIFKTEISVGTLGYVQKEGFVTGTRDSGADRMTYTGKTTGHADGSSHIYGSHINMPGGNIDKSTNLVEQLDTRKKGTTPGGIVGQILK